MTSQHIITPKPLRIRWLMISFALMATILNYVDRLAFNYLSAEGALRDLIPNDYFGYITTAFFIAYMLSNGVSGFIIDRLGTRIGYACCMAFWTTASMLSALANTPFQFGVARFFLGIGEAGNWPAAIKLTNEWFPPSERSTASGIFNSGAAIGSIIAPPLIVYLGANYGWKTTFIIIGAVGYLWLAIYWFVYYTPKSAVAEAKAKPIPKKILLKNPFIWKFTLAKFFMDPVWYFITFWIGRYLVDVHHWTLGKIGIYAMIPFIAADLGNILGGFFTQFLIKKGVDISKARKTTLLISGLMVASSLIFGPLIINSPSVALAILAIAGFGYSAYLSNSMAVPGDIVPQNTTATIWGLASVGSGMGGALFQFLSGIFVNQLSKTYNYSIAYNSVFIGYGFLALTSVLIMVFVIGKFEKDEKLFKLIEAD